MRRAEAKLCTWYVFKAMLQCLQIRCLKIELLLTMTIFFQTEYPTLTICLQFEKSKRICACVVGDFSSAHCSQLEAVIGACWEFAGLLGMMRAVISLPF